MQDEFCCVNEIANWSEILLRFLPCDCNLVVTLLGPPSISSTCSSLLTIGNSLKWGNEVASKSVLQSR